MFLLLLLLLLLLLFATRCVSEVVGGAGGEHGGGGTPRDTRLVGRGDGADSNGRPCASMMGTAICIPRCSFYASPHPCRSAEGNSRGQQRRHLRRRRRRRGREDDSANREGGKPSMRNGTLSQHNTNTHGYTRTHETQHNTNTENRNKKQRIEDMHHCRVVPRLIHFSSIHPNHPNVPPRASS